MGSNAQDRVAAIKDYLQDQLKLAMDRAMDEWVPPEEAAYHRGKADAYEDVLNMIENSS
jgi:hypothetical protein